MAADISLIVPFYNESENIDDLCPLLDSFAASRTYKLELVFVNDGSTDDSFAKLQAYEFENAAVRLISFTKNYGSHAAIRAGLTTVDSRFAMVFLADMQEPVELIDRLYAEICATGYEVVYAKRAKSENEVYNKVGAGSRLYSWLMRRFAVKDYPDGGFDNFIISQKVISILNAHIEPNSSVYLQILSLGFPHSFISCVYNERHRGVSKWTLSKKIKLFIDSFVSFSYIPIRAVSVIGILLALAGFIYALYIIIIKVFNLYQFEAGFPTLISLLLIGFGLTNFSIGIVAEYLWRTLDVTRGRPTFVIDRIIEKNGEKPE